MLPKSMEAPSPLFPDYGRHVVYFQQFDNSVFSLIDPNILHFPTSGLCLFFAKAFCSLIYRSESFQNLNPRLGYMIDKV